MRFTTAEFWDQCTPEPNTGCWLWVHENTAYAIVTLDGVRQGAHRHAYELATGRKLGRKDACHSCDVKACVNPAHLWAGTRSENVRDAWQKAKAGVLKRHPLPRRARRDP